MKIRVPAEWETQKAVCLAWPLNPDTWPDCRERVERKVAQLVSWIRHHQTVRILCPLPDQERVHELLGNQDDAAFPLEWMDLETNDVWCRDYGPIFIEEGDQLSSRAFEYNAWGGKFPPWDHDAAASAHMADALGCPFQRIPLVGEGGAIEVNGQGTLLTTRSVFLNPNRNPNSGIAEIETLFREHLGIQRTIWLESGLIGDDTDGHIDMLTRFVSENHVLTCTDVGGANQKILERNEALLKEQGLSVSTLPLPEPLTSRSCRDPVVPGSYANYLLLNGVVILPGYGPADADLRAKSIIREHFPDRVIYQLDCQDILLEGGAVHCLTCHQPDLALSSRSER